MRVRACVRERACTSKSGDDDDDDDDDESASSSVKSFSFLSSRGEKKRSRRMMKV